MIFFNFRWNANKLHGRIVIVYSDVNVRIPRIPSLIVSFLVAGERGRTDDDDDDDGNRIVKELRPSLAVVEFNNIVQNKSILNSGTLCSSLTIYFK